MKISENSFVKMHFKFRLKDGTIAEDTENYNRAFVFQMGQDCFTPKVESELLGSSVGDKKRVVCMPEEGFGEKHPAMIYSVPKNRFPSKIELEVGLIVAFNQKNGTEIAGIVLEINENDVMVDFNHPLAGQIIVFEATILEIADTEEELDENIVG